MILLYLLCFRSEMVRVGMGALIRFLQNYHSLSVHGSRYIMNTTCIYRTYFEIPCMLFGCCDVARWLEWTTHPSVSEFSCPIALYIQVKKVDDQIKLL